MMVSGASKELQPPGHGGADVLSVIDAEDDVPIRPQLRAWHPIWGVLLGFLFVVGDAMLYPGQFGLSAAAKMPLLIAVSLAAVTMVLAWRDETPRPWLWLMIGAVAGVIVAAASGDWFNGATTAPTWRDAVVPSIDLVLIASAAGVWYMGRREGGEVLLVTGVVATGMIVYGQESPMTWASIVAVAATFLFLVPAVGPFARITGIAVHAVALLGLIQHRPDWFTWSPFPFLTLMPVYLIAVYFREQATTRRVAWWTGAVVATLLFLLGTSTLIGNLRRGFPAGDSLFLQALGLGFGAALALLWWLQRRQGGAAPAPMPTGPQ